MEKRQPIAAHLAIQENKKTVSGKTDPLGTALAREPVCIPRTDPAVLPHGSVKTGT